jgi:Bacterial regulatory protein, Fis family
MPRYAVRERPEPGRLLEFSAVDRTVTKRLVGHTLANIERELILETLRHCNGNRTRSADVLGISFARRATESASIETREPPCRNRHHPDRNVSSAPSEFFACSRELLRRKRVAMRREKLEAEPLTVRGDPHCSANHQNSLHSLFRRLI